jgi:hypothetical protein
MEESHGFGNGSYNKEQDIGASDSTRRDKENWCKMDFSNQAE